VSFFQTCNILAQDTSKQTAPRPHTPREPLPFPPPAPAPTAIAAYSKEEILPLQPQYHPQEHHDPTGEARKSGEERGGKEELEEGEEEDEEQALEKEIRGIERLNRFDRFDRSPRAVEVLQEAVNATAAGASWPFLRESPLVFVIVS
jgi:hypothetical protein